MDELTNQEWDVVEEILVPFMGTITAALCYGRTCHGEVVDVDRLLEALRIRLIAELQK